jgi:16S rRNA (guanine527-N7)-methyltransferase
LDASPPMAAAVTVSAATAARAVCRRDVATDEKMGDLLAEARNLGFLGAGSISRHVEQSRAFAAAAEAILARRSARYQEASGSPHAVVDLGSGSGVPGLVLALHWQSTAFVLVDANLRRTGFLLRAVQELGLTTRVMVVTQRAEDFGRTPSRRGGFDLATARGFGRPGVVAECAAPLLGIGGLLVVSEPPRGSTGAPGRWPTESLAELGMGEAELVGSDYRFAVVTQERMCPLRYPRRVGVPAKRPLF